MKRRLVLLACLGIGLGAGPALAFKNIEGCDIVAFAAKSSPVRIAPERWQAFREQAEFLLSEPPSAAANNWRGLAAKLVDIQKTLLAPDKGSEAYRDYLTSDNCRVLTRLDSGAVETLLDEVARSAPEPAATALRLVTEAARTQFDRIERSARFRSGRDKTLMGAQYYCFVAGAIAALLPPERQQAIALESFGNTVGCKEAGRTE